MKRSAFGALLLSSVLLGFASMGADAAEVRVMISGGFSAAYKQLVPEFERATGHKVVTAYGPSMGTTQKAIPASPANAPVIAKTGLDPITTDAGK